MCWSFTKNEDIFIFVINIHSELISTPKIWLTYPSQNLELKKVNKNQVQNHILNKNIYQD